MGAPGRTDRTYRDALRHQPAIAAALGHLHDAAWAAVDHTLLELCRLRMAMLLGAPIESHRLDDAVVADLARWPLAERFGPAPRACLAFTEQYVIDVASMPRSLVDDVRATLGDDGLLDFVNGLLVVEQRLRLTLAWERLLEPAPA